MDTDSLTDCDLLFVLAGKQNRKVYALNLFHRGLVPRLLLSVSRFDIRPFGLLQFSHQLNLSALARPLPVALRHFFVTVEGNEVHAERIAPGRLGTLREISALARWLRNHPEIKSVAILSSWFHLRRVQMCCETFLQKEVRLCFHAVPEEGDWWKHSRTRFPVLLELVKVPCYKLLLTLRRWFGLAVEPWTNDTGK